MSKEAAKSFAEAYGEDSAIERAVTALPKELCNSLEAIAQVAHGLGYDVAPDELAEAFAAKRTADFEVLDSAELSNEELGQVSGGDSTHDCYSDYNPNDWCWYNDHCTNVNNYYRLRPECQQTYDPNENCVWLDNCNSNVCLNYPTNPNKDDEWSFV